VALAVVRSLSSARSRRYGEDEEEFEQELIDQYAIACAAAGTTDQLVSQDRTAIFEFVRFVGRRLWTAAPDDADRYLSWLRGTRGQARSTVQGKAGALARFYEFVINRYQGDIHALFGCVVVQPIDEFNRPTNVANNGAVRVPPGDEEVRVFFEGWGDGLAQARKFLPAARDYLAASLWRRVGLRINETVMLDVRDWRPELGELGELHIRFGKGSRGRGAKTRMVPAINEVAALIERDEQPFCAKCPPDDEDPVAVVVEVVAGVAPAVPAKTVAAAVRAAVPRAGRRRELAWALQDRPELLTGAGAEAPAPCVLRLIDALCRADAAGIVRPPCPHCGRFIPLVKRRAGVWLCRTCVAKSRAEQCAPCGAVREPAARDEHGQPLCATCLVSEPANLETCTGCGRRRRVATRTPDGSLCGSCNPWKVLTCGICGRTAPCVITQATGQPWCRACKQRWARCTSCGTVKPVRGGTVAAPLCATCTRPDPEFWRTYPSCGEPGQLLDRPCVRCVLHRRVRELLTVGDGQVRPELQALHDNLADYQRPATVLTWLRKDTAAAILHEIGTGRRPLTHAALDELPDGKPIEHLRSILVATAALPARYEHLARLERWTARLIAERRDRDEQQQLLRRYGLWHLLRRLRGRLGDRHATRQEAAAVQNHLRAAVALLDWLTGRGLTLATCQQRDLDSWAADQSSYRRDAGHFVRWARAQKLTTREFPAVRWPGPGEIDTESR
jgi:hypothetical protein